MPADIDQLPVQKSLIDLSQHSQGDFGLTGYKLSFIFDDIILVKYIDTDDDNGDFINGDANFSTFYLSIITLFRCATGEDWNGVMHDTFESVGTGAIIYWISF